jgi:predicted RNase H-like nuclease
MPVGPADRPVVGVDGCPGGWAVVEWSTQGVSAQRVEDLAPLLARLRAGQVAAVAIDMPVGLLDHHPRACDVEARRLLGPRRSSIFPTPIRATLDAVDYDDACNRSRAAIGKALSKQAYNLLPKIAELDRLVQPADQDRLVEAHPECAFARLAGEPLAHPKRTAEGQALRIALLAEHHRALGQLIDEYRNIRNRAVSSRRDPHHVPLLDLIDATVLAVTACRVADGSEIRLGTDVDRRGLQARIVY